MPRNGYIEVKAVDLKEFIEAAEEVRDEATSAISEVQLGEPTNVLHHQTENRFALALDALKFELGGARRG
jgi:hypothetical protein